MEEVQTLVDLYIRIDTLENEQYQLRRREDLEQIIVYIAGGSHARIDELFAMGNAVAEQIEGLRDQLNEMTGLLSGEERREEIARFFRDAVTARLA